MLPDYLQVPEALKTHSELIKRGVILDEPLNIGSVYATHAFQPPRFVVKVLSPASEEEAIISRLQHDRSARNHLIPCEIIPSDPALLLMPSVCNIAWPMRRERNFFIKLCTLLKVFRQIAEGIDHLHSLRIAHLDMCFGNVMIAAPHVEREHPRTKAGRVYIIDFDRSRQLDLGPGLHPPIELPSTQYEPPLQMKTFDPYSWDVYCMGRLFEHLTEVSIPSASSSPFRSRRTVADRGLEI
uniref:Cytochrome P450 monooxygenase CYP52X1 n=1 Tax=Ganoderma boninense TaxID=34458 RepID=A0A5K1JW68_9APHY|nr:Cytochrome P450 monooxygenase CYP52X1 [Ganoderma boninense]